VLAIPNHDQCIPGLSSQERWISTGTAMGPARPRKHGSRNQIRSAHAGSGRARIGRHDTDYATLSPFLQPPILGKIFNPMCDDKHDSHIGLNKERQRIAGDDRFATWRRSRLEVVTQMLENVSREWMRFVGLAL
jgi:hypothetical protein